MLKIRWPGGVLVYEYQDSTLMVRDEVLEEQSRSIHNTMTDLRVFATKISSNNIIYDDGED